MWNRIWSLVVKEVYALWRDKRSRVVLIVPPLVQLFVFAFAATLEVKDVKIGVLNKDNGRESFELIERIGRSTVFKKVDFLTSMQEARSYMDNQRGIAVFAIDQEFSKNLRSGKQVHLQALMDGRKSNASQVVLGYLTQIINRFMVDLTEEKGLRTEKIKLIPRNWFNENLIHSWFTVPGLLPLLVMVEALLISGLSIARERELGTFDQLLISPIRMSEILIGKALPAIFFAILQGTLIIFCSIFIFKIPFIGSLFLLYMSMFFYTLSVVGVGLFISSLCSVQNQALIGVAMFLTPAITLSGFATPIDNMPSWLQLTTYINPVSYFIEVSRGIFLKAVPMSHILQHTWPLIPIAIFNLSAAALLFRSRTQ